MLSNSDKDSLDIYQERLINANYNLWNALISFNSILLGLFAILSVIQPQKISNTYFHILIILCSSSIVFLIVNHVIIKRHFLKLGRMIFDKLIPINNNEKKDKVLKKAKCNFIIMTISEYTCLGFAALEVILVYIIIFA